MPRLVFCAWLVAAVSGTAPMVHSDAPIDAFPVSLEEQAALESIEAARAAGGYQPDPEGIPDEWKCAWRKLAYDYAGILKPSLTELQPLVADALAINDLCNTTNYPSGNGQLPLPLAGPTLPPAGDATFFVDYAHGSDSNAGTQAMPLKTLAAGVQHCRAAPGPCSVVLRGGTHYMDSGEPVVLSAPADNDLRIQGFPGEAAWVSGAIPLGALTWEPYNVTKPPPPEMQVFQGENVVEGKGCPQSDVCSCVPDTPDAAACTALCLNTSSCTAFTYHDNTTGTWSHDCCMLSDGTWEPKAESGHTSGRKVVDPAMNVWRAALSPEFEAALLKATKANRRFGQPPSPSDQRAGWNGTGLLPGSGDAAEILGLRAGSSRMPLARMPNGDPETTLWPNGWFASSTVSWNATAPKPNTSLQVQVTSPNRTNTGTFEYYIGGINGTCDVFSPPFSYWCNNAPPGGGGFTYYVPTSMTVSDPASYGFPWSSPERVRLYTWRRAHWSSWAFEVEAIDPVAGTVSFSRGGFQGARGGPGSDWYVENSLSFLDAPGEWFHDAANHQLLYFANGTAGTPPPPELAFEATGLQQLIVAQGSKESPVSGLVVEGVGFRDTAPTLFEPHAVPSGGDWALERYAALSLQGVDNATVRGCRFWKIDGNALLVSRFARNVVINDNEFAWLGGSATILWGYTDELSDGGIHGYDMTAGDHPSGTVYSGNVAREIGIYEGQSSCLFQAKQELSNISSFVCFNLQRAGFNVNDGAGGGDIYERLLGFGSCRTSSDHSVGNSWDRQPFLTTATDPNGSFNMLRRTANRSLLVSNYGAVKGGWDHDDGSRFWTGTHLCNIYGWGLKEAGGAGGITSDSNVQIFPSIGFRGSSVTWNGLPQAEMAYINELWLFPNVSKSVYSQEPSCRVTKGVLPPGYNATIAHNNTVYGFPGTEIVVSCGSDELTLAEWQKLSGSDEGTTWTMEMPPVEDVIAACKHNLQIT